MGVDADDLLAASIGQNLGNTEPPDRSQAAHGLPLEDFTLPASTEARSRQYKDRISPLARADSGPRGPFDKTSIASSALPDKPGAGTRGSAATESLRCAAADSTGPPAIVTPDNISLPVIDSGPLDPFDTTPLASSVLPDMKPGAGTRSSAAAKSSRSAASSCPSSQTPIDIHDTTRGCAVPAVFPPLAEAPAEPHHPFDHGHCRVLPDQVPGDGAMSDVAPPFDIQLDTTLPSASKTAPHAPPEPRTFSQQCQTFHHAEIRSIGARPSSVPFSDSGSDGSVDAKAISCAPAECRPNPAFPAFTPPMMSLPASDRATERTLVPKSRLRCTPTVAKLMHELDEIKREREHERDQYDNEIHLVEEERDQAQADLHLAQQDLTRAEICYEKLLAAYEKLQTENERPLALTSADSAALTLMPTVPVASKPIPTALVAAPTPAADSEEDLDVPSDDMSARSASPVTTVKPVRAAPVSDDDSGLETKLLPIESKYMSSKVQDKEHVMAVERATGVDPAGMIVFHRFLYTTDHVDKREENRGRTDISKMAMTAGIEVADTLNIPDGLYSDDTYERSIAYKRKFRGDLAGKIRYALQLGSDWQDVLRSLYHRFNREDDGHPLLAQYVLVAQRDTRLHANPLLHAETLMFKLDSSFYSRAHGISDYDEITSRERTMDASTLLAKIVDAYLQKLDDPKLNRKNILKDKNHRSELFKKARRCLRSDERDPDRGKVVSAEFNRLWGIAQQNYTRDPTKAALENLDLQRFAERELKEVETRLERQRSDESWGRRSDPVARTDRTVAAAQWTNPLVYSDAETDCVSDDGSRRGPPPPRHRPKGQGAQRRRDERRALERQHFHTYTAEPHHY